MGVDMISLFKYISARRSLSEIKKTIKAMGGPDECSAVILAQYDFTELETKYYEHKMLSEIILSLLFVAVLVAAYGAYDGI